MTSKEILARLPYTASFLFVDELLEVNEKGCRGTFTFYPDLDFYRGHFKDNPLTPGVILTECCAQIGLVCLGIYLLGKSEMKNKRSVKGDFILKDNFQIGMSSSRMDFLLPVFPDEKVIVTSRKIYFRFNKLKCAVKMRNAQGKLVCQGEISGMIKSGNNG